jgi:hypothetical protein
MYNRACAIAIVPGETDGTAWEASMMNRHGHPFTEFPEIVQDFKMLDWSAQPPSWP